MQCFHHNCRLASGWGKRGWGHVANNLLCYHYGAVESRQNHQPYQSVCLRTCEKFFTRNSQRMNPYAQCIYRWALETSKHSPEFFLPWRCISHTTFGRNLKTIHPVSHITTSNKEKWWNGVWIQTKENEMLCWSICRKGVFSFKTPSDFSTFTGTKINKHPILDAFWHHRVICTSKSHRTFEFSSILPDCFVHKTNKNPRRICWNP